MGTRTFWANFGTTAAAGTLHNRMIFSNLTTIAYKLLAGHKNPI